MNHILHLAAGLQSFVPAGLVALMTMLFVRNYLRKQRRQEELAYRAAKEAGIYSHGPQAQHPQIDESRCIGCATCTTVCPEGDVLGMIGGKANFLKPYKCVGHGMCAEACPVGAITMMMASPSVNANLPQLTPEHETTIPNLFIIGELGGLALIKNAVNQGREVVDTIRQRLSNVRGATDAGVHDILIIGAGPAGISASLRAIEHKLLYLTLEEGEIGGTVARYPRQKLVMTSPVEFPLYGKFRKTELSKEDLLQFWAKVMHRADFKARTGEKMLDVQLCPGGVFEVTSSKGSYRARAVILAIGKSGTPRKLGVPGEDLGKVMYRLIEVDHYRDSHIFIVGGGDSAIEAATGLAMQKGNCVTLSYRQGSFNRVKERNLQRITECIRQGKVEVLFNSNVVEIKPNSVLLDHAGAQREIVNDFVWIFAGGTPPHEILRKIGVGFGREHAQAEVATQMVSAE